jgi:hypothetical protein
MMSIMTEYNQTGSGSELQRVNVFIDLEGKPKPDSEKNRQENIDVIKTWFEERAEPIKDAIRKIGGVVLEQSWMYGSLRIGISEDRVVANYMEVITEIPNVVEVRLPNQLKRD